MSKTTPLLSLSRDGGFSGEEFGLLKKFMLRLGLLEAPCFGTVFDASPFLTMVFSLLPLEFQVISIWDELVHFLLYSCFHPALCLALASAFLCSNRSFRSAEGVQEQGKKKCTH